MAVRRELAASVLTDLLFDEPGVGRCLVAPDGRVLRANGEWLRSTGLCLDDVLGRDVLGLFPETRELALSMHARARAGHRVEVPRHAQRIQGRDTLWEGSIAPVPMDDGTGLLITAREVTAESRDALRRDQAATEGRLNASRLETLLATIPVGVVVTDRSGRFVATNSEVEDFFGGITGDAAGPTHGYTLERPEGGLFPPDELPLVRALRGDASRSVELIAKRADGTERVLLASGAPVRDEGGAIAGAIAVLQDITERKRAEDALRTEERRSGETEQRFRTILENSRDAISLVDLATGRYVFLSPAQVELTGFSAEELRDMSPEQACARVHPDDRHLWSQRQQEIAAGRDSNSPVEYRWKVKSGEYRWFSESRKIVRDGQGRAVALVGVSRDISDRKRIDEERRQAVQRYERQVRLFEGVASTTPDFVYVFDLHGRFLYANEQLLKVWGMQLPQVIGKTPRDLGYEQWHHDMHMREIAQVIETKQPIKGEVPFEAPLTGIFGVYEYIFTPVIGPDGEVEIVAGTTRDVTERKRAEEALRDKQSALEDERARLQAIIDTIPVGFFIVDGSGKVVLTNDEAKRTWGGAVPLEKIGDYGEYVGYWPETGERLDAEEWPAAQALLHGRRTKGVLVDIERFDGTRGTILFSGAPVRDAAGQTTGAVVAIQDISDLRAAQARLEEEDRRKSEFLALLSHELRNPLAPIRNSIHLLERAAPGSEQAARAKEVVRRQTEHLTHLVDDLLDITRISHGKIPLERTRVDLREIVRKTTDDLHSVFAQAAVELRVEYVTFGPLWIHADATRMAQVLGNLLQNSVKFTSRGGTVAVRLAANDGRAELSVRDNGIGIEPQTVARIFEPFAQADHALARTAGGLGLGLALVRGLVELHGGTVEARSDGRGQGAEFLVRVPLAEPGAELDESRPAAPRPAARVILIIEDNLDGAQSLAELLELEGHRVRVARDGRTGIELARELRPDVVLCDIGLPDIEGYDVARTLRGDDGLQCTRLVALSGYAQAEDRKRAHDAGFDAHIAKPPDLGELTRVLADER